MSTLPPPTPPMPPSSAEPGAPPPGPGNAVSKLAVASLVLAIAGFLCLFGVMGIPAVICGHLAIAKIKMSRGTLEGYPLALVGLIIGYLQIVLTLLVVALILGMTTFTAGSSPGTHEQPAPVVHTISREKGYMRIGGQRLGQHLTETYPNRRVLVLLPPNDPVDTTPVAEGLAEGLGREGLTATLAVPAPAAGNNGGAPGTAPPVPLDYYFTTELLAETLAPHAGSFDLVVSCVGLPLDMDFSRFTAEGIAFAIASGSVYNFRQQIADGTVVAAVTHNPRAVYDDNPLPEDPGAAFDKRYVLLTPDNVQDLARRHPEVLR